MQFAELTKKQDVQQKMTTPQDNKDFLAGIKNRKKQPKVLSECVYDQSIDDQTDSDAQSSCSPVE